MSEKKDLRPYIDKLHSGLGREGVEPLLSELTPEERQEVVAQWEFEQMVNRKSQDKVAHVVYKKRKRPKPHILD